MSTPEVCKASLIAFEKQFHTDVFKWIQWKLANCTLSEAEILDFSVDDCVFSQLLQKTIGAKRLVSAVRGQPSELIDPTVEVKQIPGLANDHLSQLDALGKFDVIIVNECTHEVENLLLFLQKLKQLLKSDDCRIFVLAHPKNPPPPIPDVAVGLWRKLAPNREEVILAAKNGGLGQVCYSASCPVKVTKQEWYNILKTRAYPALKQCAKCTDKEIREYVNSIRMWVLFEEKILIFLVTPRPDQGDAMEKEVEPSTKNPTAKAAPPAAAAQNATTAPAPAAAPAAATAPPPTPAEAPQHVTPPATPTSPTAAPSDHEHQGQGEHQGHEKSNEPVAPGEFKIEKIENSEAVQPEALPALCEGNKDGQDAAKCETPVEEKKASEDPMPQPGVITPLPAAEKAAGIIAEKVVERAQLKTQPSVADDYPTSGSDEE